MMHTRSAVAIRALRATVTATVVGLALLTLGPGPAQAAGRPAILEVVTVPAIPNAKFMVDGKVRHANRQGIVRVEVSTSRKHRVVIVDRKISQRNRQLSFVRWYHGNHEQDYLPELAGLTIKRNIRLKAAFRATYTLHYSFVDQAKAPVNAERVTRVEFRGDHGQTVTGDGSGTLRVVGIRPVVSGGTLLAKQVRYRVQRADVDGSNVVQVNAQTFVPSHKAEVVIPLLLRSVHFSTRDFLFGHPVGQAVELTYPNGQLASVALDADGKATVERLARGHYTVKVDASGLSFQRPFVLSRNQYVDLPVLSRLDLGVIGGAVLALVVGLYLLRVRNRAAWARAAARRQ